MRNSNCSILTIILSGAPQYGSEQTYAAIICYLSSIAKSSQQTVDDLVNSGSSCEEDPAAASTKDEAALLRSLLAEAGSEDEADSTARPKSPVPSVVASSMSKQKVSAFPPAQASRHHDQKPIAPENHCNNLKCDMREKAEELIPKDISLSSSEETGDPKDEEALTEILKECCLEENIAGTSSDVIPQMRAADPLDLVDAYERSTVLKEQPLSGIQYLEESMIYSPLSVSRVQYRYHREIGSALGSAVENKLVGKSICIFVSLIQHQDFDRLRADCSTWAPRWG